MRRCLGCFENIKENLEVCPFCGYVNGTPPEEAVHMEPGTILSERYIIGKVIGYGGFGVTYIAWDAKLEQKVAIKEYLPSEFSTRMPGQSTVTVFNGAKSEQFTSGLNKFVDEAKRLSKFQKEDGIVRIFDCIAENDTAYIIMEYLQGESLADRLSRIGTIPEEEAINILMPVMKSLEVVHNEGIIHRDIAPDNIFLTNDGQVKLIDFGAARFATTSHSRSLTVIIKPGYSAEEQYRSRSDQGPHTDVYSLAATLYKMITGVTPPDALERRAKIENAKRDILVEPHKIKKDISLVTENALLNALNIQIEDRTPTVQEFIDNLTASEPVKRVYGKIKRIDFYRMPLWLKILAPSLLGLFIIFGILLATGVISFSSLFKTDVEIPEGYTVVPNIEGLSIDDATNQLALNELNYTTGGSVISDFVEANLIVFQDPEGGRIIPINSLVAITVSRGSGIVEEAVNGISTVPIFIWTEEAVAINDFELAGLVPTVEYVHDDNVAAGQVIRVTDANGNELASGDELPEGSSVILYVSLGPEGFAMPNVIGMTETAAKNSLVQAGLVVIVTHVQNTTVPEGTVFAQSINAGSTVSLGTQVTISVATAIPVTDTPIPTDFPTVSTTTAANNEGNSSGSGTNITNTPTSGGRSGTTTTPTVNPTGTTTVAPTSTEAPTPIPEYTVSFDTDGGSSVPSRTYSSGDQLGELPPSSKPNYTFDYWTSGGASVSSSTTVTSDMTLVAHWTPKVYTITFVTDGGTSVSSRSVNYGDPIGELPTSSKSHYDFLGWTYDGVSVSSSTIVSSDMTLTAQWSPVQYTVTFNSAGGSQVASRSVSYGQPVGALPDSSRNYYRLTGWYTSSGTAVDSSYVVSSDITLTAQWELKNEWSSWSSWSSTAVSEQTEDGLTIVEVATQEHAATYRTQYMYERAWGWNGYYICYPWVSGNCVNWEQTNWLDSPLPLYAYEDDDGGAYYNVPTYGRGYAADGTPTGYDIYWYSEQTRQIEDTPAYTEYRYRTRLP